LAHEADVDRTYVSALERSEYAATIDMVDKLATALGVEASALLQRPATSRQRKI
jgi:transcriptional regulator with XRE-family HTH domain